MDNPTFTPTETRLWSHLADHVGQACARDTLRRATWPAVEVRPNAVDLYVCYLRRKIEGTPWRIVTVRGVGYRLEWQGTDA